MKKTYYIIVCLIGFVTFLCPGSRCSGKQSFPKPQGAVNDFASLIPAREEQVMENLCKEVWQKTLTGVLGKGGKIRAF